jgi:hypothetical protein
MPKPFFCRYLVIVIVIVVSQILWLFDLTNDPYLIIVIVIVVSQILWLFDRINNLYLIIVIVIAVSKCVSFNVVDWPHQHLQHVPPTQRQTVDSSDLLQ